MVISAMEKYTTGKGHRVGGGGAGFAVLNRVGGDTLELGG